jgi:signal transduction histidine kinase
MDPLLRVINVSRTFSDLWALENINLDIMPGEVVGVAGSSGAGKTVLAKIIAGLYEPSSGDLYFEGRRYSGWRPELVRELGIEVIHQRPELVDRLDITANVFLGREVTSGLFKRNMRLADRKEMDAQTQRIFDELGVRFSSLHEKAANLSGEERQIVAIARALVGPGRLVVIDGPLVGLSFTLQKRLLELVHRWQERGCAVLICSDNLGNLFAATDRLIVLNKGHKVADRRTDETTQEEIVALMVGTPPPEQVTPLIWALDSFYRAREQAENLQHNHMLLQRDLAAQDTLNRQLLDQLSQQVAALDQANAALQDAQRRLLLEREDERKHLARELHDQAIQDLLGIGYQIEEMLAVQTFPEDLLPNLALMQDDVRRLIGDLRQICNNLRPPALDSLGLGAAIRSHAQQWAERHNINLTLEIAADLRRLPEATELSIFRIVQEGLNNIQQHALATQASVSLKHTSPRTLQITISDNGRGLNEDADLGVLAANSHYGLLGISERVALLGGKLQLQNRPSGGLSINVEISHPRAQNAKKSPSSEI